MNNFTVIKLNGQLVTDSREVSVIVGKEHKNLLRDIKGYKDILDDSSNLSSQDFFIESTYLNAQNKLQPCYLLTRKGCDLVANKMTGEKGVLFTATYVTKFEEMEKQLKENVQLPSLGDIVNLIRETRINMKEQNCTPREIAITIKQLCEFYGVQLPNCFVKPEETTLNDIYDMIDFVFDTPRNKRKNLTYDDFIIEKTITVNKLVRAPE